MTDFKADHSQYVEYTGTTQVPSLLAAFLAVGCQDLIFKALNSMS